mmetsp:Transcript_64815/g.115250  ORF Transcript_64815/g.115250 Transcript_64815/m.115250 type:complete len:304 (+) Transcript_64815:1923-2834(+)
MTRRRRTQHSLQWVKLHFEPSLSCAIPRPPVRSEIITVDSIFHPVASDFVFAHLDRTMDGQVVDSIPDFKLNVLKSHNSAFWPLLNLLHLYPHFAAGKSIFPILDSADVLEATSFGPPFDKPPLEGVSFQVVHRVGNRRSSPVDGEPADQGVINKIKGDVGHMRCLLRHPNCAADSVNGIVGTELRQIHNAVYFYLFEVRQVHIEVNVPSIQCKETIAVLFRGPCHSDLHVSRLPVAVVRAADEGFVLPVACDVPKWRPRHRVVAEEDGKILWRIHPLHGHAACDECLLRQVHADCGRGGERF